MLAEVTIDGMEESEFRQSIETMLREGQADDAARRIRPLLAPFAGEGQPLPARIMRAAARDLTIVGWNALAARIEELDRPGLQISAIGIDIVDSRQSRVPLDPQGFCAPNIETTFYNDSAFAFSQSSRADLAEAYGDGKAAWQGAFEDIDDIIAVEDIDDLHGTVFALQRKCDPVAGEEGEAATQDERQAWLLGSCYIAVLIHQAVRDMALRGGLPRPLAIIVGANDSFPGFDAPAIAAKADTSATDDFFASLAMVSDDMLAELEPEAEAQPEPEPEPEPEPVEDIPGWDQPMEDGWDEDVAWHLPPPGIHVTGKQLRRRFVTPESIAETTPVEKTGLLARIFKRN